MGNFQLKNPQLPPNIFWDITNTILAVGATASLGTGNFQFKAPSGISPKLILTTNDYVNTTTGSSLGLIVGGTSGNVYAGIQSYINGGNGTGILKLNSSGNSAGTLVGPGTITASTALDIQSTTQAFCPPRMTSVQKNAIGTLSAGMVVFDTTLNKLCVYGAAAWETITSV